MRSEDKSVSRVAIEQIRLRGIYAFSSEERMLSLEGMKQTTSWNPDTYSKSARFVSDLGEPLLKLLDPNQVR